MALIEFVEVSLSELNPAVLWGRNLEFPRAGTWAEGHAIEIIGWVLGREAPAVAVEMTADGRLLGRVPVNIQRPDVAAFHSQVEDGARSGFQARVQMGGIGELEVTVEAVLDNQVRVAIGRIRARRRWREDLARTGTPLISVVIPCYNQARFLDEAIESVLAQSYPHFEVAVIDDGSTDNAEEVAARYAWVRYIRQENGGLAAARNTGLRRTIGEYLVFLDADDRLLPRALETGLAAFAEHPECAFVAGHCKPITVDGTPFPASENSCVDRDHYAALLRKCFIYPPGAVMFRRSVFETVRNFDVSVSPCADYDLYLRVAKDFPIWCHHQMVAEYRKHGANMTRNAALMLKSGFAVLRSQRQYIKRNELWKKAYDDGIEFIRACYGPALAGELHSEIRSGNAWQAMPGLLALVRYYPAGLFSLLRQHS